MTRNALKNKKNECISAIEKWRDNPCYKNIVIYRIITLNDICKQLNEQVDNKYTYETWNITNDIINDFRQNPSKYYRQIPLNQSKDIQKKTETKTQAEVKIKKVKQSTQKHTITLAWTEMPGHDVTSTIDKIKEYFNDMDIQPVDIEVFDNGNKGIEHTINYEFEGDSQSFKILKYSAQFILDTISNTDYETFNIAIFSKRNWEENDGVCEKPLTLEEQVNILKKDVAVLQNQMKKLMS